jgi:hypothetical protein
MVQAKRCGEPWRVALGNGRFELVVDTSKDGAGGGSVAGGAHIGEAGAGGVGGA